MDGTPVPSFGAAHHSGNHQMHSAFAPLAAAPAGAILPGVSAANPVPLSRLSPPRPALGAGMSDVALAATRAGPPRGAAADVESARAMASLSGLPADAPPEQYADAIRTAGTARLHELHRNAANVKLKTADGKNIWTLHEDEGVLGFVVAAIQRHRYTPAVPYVDWPWDTCSARHLGASRSAKQCRERWANVLNPFMKHDEPWTAAEMDLLIRLHGTFGNKWREIAKRCAGRSTNKVKNLFYSCERRIRRTHPSLKEGAPGYAAEIAKELFRVLAGQPKSRRHDEEAAVSATGHLPKIGQQASLRGPSGSFHQGGAAGPRGAPTQPTLGQQHAWPQAAGSTPPMGPGSLYGSGPDMYGTSFAGHPFVGSSAGGYPAAAYGPGRGPAPYAGGWPGARPQGPFASAVPSFSPPSTGVVVVKTPAGPMRLMPDGSFVALPERSAATEQPHTYAGGAGPDAFGRHHASVSSHFPGGGFASGGYGRSVFASQQQHQHRQQQMQMHMDLHQRQLQQHHGDMSSAARPTLARSSGGSPPIPSDYDMRPAFHTAPGSAAAMHYYRPSSYQPTPTPADAWSPAPARPAVASTSSVAAPTQASTAPTAVAGGGGSPAGFAPTSSGRSRPRAASHGLESLAQAAAVDTMTAHRETRRGEASLPSPADASRGTATMSVDEEDMGSAGVGSNISLHAARSAAAAARASRPLIGRSAAGVYGTGAEARLALVEATDDGGYPHRSRDTSSAWQAAPTRGAPAAAAAAAERSGKRQRSPRQSDGSSSARSAHSDTRRAHDPKRSCNKTTPRAGDDADGRQTMAVGGTASMAATSAMRWPGVGLSASGMMSQAVREARPAAPMVCVPRADAGPLAGAYPMESSSSSASSSGFAAGTGAARAAADEDNARPRIRPDVRRHMHGPLGGGGGGGGGYDSGDDDQVPATSRSSAKRRDATGAGDSCGGFVVRNGRGGTCEVVSLEEAIESMSV